MAVKSRRQFQLKRIAGFFKLLLKSKMAIAGVILLGAFTFLAVGAPILTPYDPQHDIVAGAYAPPGWMTYLSEGSRLSQNMLLESKPEFPDDASLQGWTLQGNNRFTMAFDSTVSFSTGSGSIKITFDPQSAAPGNYSVVLRKTFHYPYNGPVARFAGSFKIYTPGATSQEPVTARVFVERLSYGATWNLTDATSWALYPFNTTRWNIPLKEIDSNADHLKKIVGTNINPAELIFSAPDDFAYSTAITFTIASAKTQPVQVNVDDLNLRLYGTSWGLLGTDATGLDVFSQMLYGARISLLVGLLSAFIGIALGLVIGLISGYLGKLVDEVLMRFTDMLLVIPSLPLLIVLIAVLGKSLGASRLPILIIVIGFLGWMGFARVVRSQVLTLKERPFVEAAKAAGAGTGHIATRHIIPNIVGLIYVNLALAVPGAILAEAALSFLGLGDTTVVSWGRMLYEVQVSAAQRMWWWVIPPGLSIALVSLSFVLIGYSLDEIFNPRLRQRR